METIHKHNNNSINNAYLNGDVVGSCKQSINNEQKIDKQEVIKKLKKCTYTTPPREVAELLTLLLNRTDTKEGHWLHIAQQWNPRAIVRVIDYITRQHQRGDQTIKNTAAYFTYLIKYRKKRRIKLIANNGSSKQL